MSTATTVERLAAWAVDVSAADIPDAVVVRARAQRDSVLAGVAASRSCDAATARVAAGASDPLYSAAAASIALDFDDYLCFAHTGHSAVLVPELVGDETEADGDARLAAQVVANEIGARLGGACVVGPLNGQMWSFVHAACAAVAAGRLLRLGERQLAHALAISLSQAPRPTLPGFMAPDSKLLGAAEPAVTGVRAARLAAAGATGPLDVLDDSRGFFSVFSYAPVPGLLGGLGEGWATRTLCVKPYPGCAYLGTVVDALLMLGPPPASDVDSVAVDAGLLTCGMDAWSATWATDPTPVTVTFSVPWTVATTLVAGRLSPVELNEVWLRARRTELAALAARVDVRHDWSLTARSAAAFAAVLPVAAVARSAGRTRLLRALGPLRRDHRALRLGPRDVVPILSLLRDRLASAGSRRFWDDDALAGFRLVAPARVTVRLRDGREIVAEGDVPRGATGHDACPPERAAAEKRAAWPDPRSDVR